MLLLFNDKEIRIVEPITNRAGGPYNDALQAQANATPYCEAGKASGLNPLYYLRKQVINSLRGNKVSLQAMLDMGCDAKDINLAITHIEDALLRIQAP